MAQVQLNVNVLEVSSHAVSLIYAACRQCYAAGYAAEMFAESLTRDPQEAEAFIRKVIGAGHESPLEHVKFTFAVEGVSRALTHQLVRHRIASYSQQSQRYVKEHNFDYVVPPSIAADETLRTEFLRTMEEIQRGYNQLLDRFAQKGITGETANQDARFVLPQAAETKIVVTMNCRELRHFFQHRCCRRAQWEIRRLADKMLELCRQHLPCVFADAGPRCVALGYCPEGARFCCGRFPPKPEAGRDS